MELLVFQFLWTATPISPRQHEPKVRGDGACSPTTRRQQVPHPLVKTVDVIAVAWASSPSKQRCWSGPLAVNYSGTSGNHAYSIVLPLAGFCICSCTPSHVCAQAASLVPILTLKSALQSSYLLRCCCFKSSSAWKETLSSDQWLPIVGLRCVDFLGEPSTLPRTEGCLN